MLLFVGVFLLRGTPWILTYAGAVGSCVSGAVLITIAKLPLLRRGILFSFGSRRLPFGRCRRLYRRGWRLVAAGAGLAGLMVACSHP